MTICIVSMANSHDTQIGGKHIHQLLLERAYKEKGYTVYTAYPSHRSVFRRIFGRIERFSSKRSDQAERFIRYCLETRANLSRQVNEVANKTTDELVFLVQDTISALAVKDCLGDSKKEIKTCLTLHGYFTNEEINYQDFVAGESRFVEASMGWERESAQWVDEIITVDTRIKNYVVDILGVADSKIHVLFNAVDDEVFAPATEEESAEIRQKNGIPQDRTVILVARRLVKKNGVMQALQAIDQLPAELPVCMLVIGDGTEKSDLQEYISRHNLHDRVKMLGGIPHAQIVEYYRSADIILLPSTKSDGIEEATSLSMLEGMACRKVVIVSAIGGMKEVITDGANGYLFEDKNIPDLCEKIQMAINDKDTSARIAEAAMEYVREKHVYKSHADRYLQIARSN